MPLLHQARVCMDELDVVGLGREVRGVWATWLALDGEGKCRR